MAVINCTLQADCGPGIIRLRPNMVRRNVPLRRVTVNSEI